MIIYDLTILFLSNSHRTILSLCCSSDNEYIDNAISICLVGMTKPLNKDSNEYKKMYNNRLLNI